MLRTVVPIVLLSLVIPIIGNANMVSFSAHCAPPAITAIQGLSVSCDGTPSGIASVTTTSAVNVTAVYQGLAEGFITDTATVMVVFGNGTGSGFFLPCLSVSYAQPYGGALAEFGVVSLDTRTPAGGTCSLSGLSQSFNRIPFTFGIPVMENLTLMVENGLPGQPGGSAAIAGFVVLDANGIQLPDATWTAGEVTLPEPALLWPVGLALVLGRAKIACKSCSCVPGYCP